jgi:glycosyltransferase involved in cell wall biosynthesis
VSETFVEGEFRSLSRRGLPVDLFATRNFREETGSRDPLDDRGLAIQRSEYLFGREIPAAALYFLARHPARTLGTLARVVAGSALSPRYLLHALALFPKSLVFARRMRSLGTVHVHGTWAHYPATAAYIAARMVGASYSFTGHAGLDVLSDTAFLAEKVRSARFILVCQSATRRRMEQLVPESAARIHTVYHGVDFSEIPPPGSLARADPPEIVSVGRLTPEKGFLDLLQAAGQLRDRRVAFKLRIFGQGPQREALEREIARLDLRDRAVLSGIAPHAEILAAMARATLVTLASYRPPNFFQDGIPNVLVEAMACGTPVLTTEHDGSRELLESGRHGVMVPERDPPRLAAAIESLLGDPERRRDMAARARARIERDFDREKNVEAIARLFRDALVERSGFLSAAALSDSPRA